MPEALLLFALALWLCLPFVLFGVAWQTAKRVRHWQGRAKYHHRCARHFHRKLRAYRDAYGKLPGRG